MRMVQWHDRTRQSSCNQAGAEPQKKRCGAESKNRFRHIANKAKASPSEANLHVIVNDNPASHNVTRDHRSENEKKHQTREREQFGENNPQHDPRYPASAARPHAFGARSISKGLEMNIEWRRSAGHFDVSMYLIIPKWSATAGK